MIKRTRGDLVISNISRRERVIKIYQRGKMVAIRIQRVAVDLIIKLKIVIRKVAVIQKITIKTTIFIPYPLEIRAKDHRCVNTMGKM